MSKRRKYHNKYNRRKQKGNTVGRNTLIAIIAIFAIIFFGSNSNNGGGKISQSIQKAPTQVKQIASSVSSKITGSTRYIPANNNLANLNYQSGKPSFVYVNNNKATLSPKKWQTNKVIYHQLDSYNRTSGANIGYLENRNLANDSLRVRQFIEPTGWHQKFVNGEPIVNRGHLIAYSVSSGINQEGIFSPNDKSGDQNNPKNLFTQTAFSNQKVQTIFEQKVREALKQGQKVIFYARPIFRGNELMARGIHLMAISTNKALNFNVYLFNVQPEVQFDYATGRSTIDRQMKVPNPLQLP